jgi:hypothetical protein
MCSKIAAFGNRAMKEIFRAKRHIIKNSVIRSFIISAVCDIIRTSETKWAEHIQLPPMRYDAFT